MGSRTVGRDGRGRRSVGIRLRLVVVAVGVVLAAMLIGGAGLVFLLEDTLERSATETATARATAVADVITSIGLSEAAATVVASPRNGQLVQIIAPDLTVFSASDAQLRSGPMAPLTPPVGRIQETEVTGLLGDAGEWAVVVRGVSARNTTFHVQVAIPISTARDVVQSVPRYLLIATPLLLAVVGLAVWFLIGRALNAVEQIRREVAGIDAGRLATRVEVPPTGDEIAALARTMNAMLDRLERADAAQRAFVSDASHELRSPLATVITATELAQQAPEPRRSELLRTALAELDRLRLLVEALMTLARSDGRRSGAAVADVDLDDLLDAQRLRLQTAGSGQVVTQLEPARIVADASALERAVRNIVDNAHRHAATTVRLSVRMAEHTAVVHVDNDGPVIAQPDRERIFERFVRLDESRSRDAGGSGLGLPIARAILEGHGGSVAVVDAADGWCRFEIRLPLRNSPAEVLPALYPASRR